MTDSNTPTIWNYGYDNADQLTSATRLNTSTEAVISQYVYGYDLAGNRTSEQIGLSVTQTGVNNLNQITGSSAGGPLQFSGTLSKPSQVTVAGNTATYGNYYSTNFSGMANVTTGTNDVPVIAHDVNGNTSTNNYQVVVPAGTGATPTYDGDGNQTYNGNGQTYTWDAENELTTITYTGGATSNFTYDALGRRLSIIEKNSGGSVTSTKQFVWVGRWITEERDASNAVTKRFFAQGEQISGTNYYYTRDHLGSIREMVSYSGTTPTIQARYDYDPYGRATPVGTVLIPSDYQYAGYYEHATSGLNLTLFRAYDPNTAKWLSRDPIEERGGVNIYGYVRNDPLNLTDELGLISGTFECDISWSNGPSLPSFGLTVPLLQLNMGGLGDNLSPAEQNKLMLNLGLMTLTFALDPEGMDWLFSGGDAANTLTNSDLGSPFDPRYPDGPTNPPPPDGSAPLTEPDGSTDISVDPKTTTVAPKTGSVDP